MKLILGEADIKEAIKAYINITLVPQTAISTVTLSDGESEAWEAEVVFSK